jgi:type VI secretion system ImpM family protein
MSAPAVNGPAVPGWFGKLPNLGDFASRRLPDAFVQPWDRWLQLGMARAREDVPGDWLAGYLVAPIRRFWLAPGVLGDGGWAGLLMPSVDRVGRHFPLTLARPLDRFDAALAGQAWYQALDGVARQVLDVNYTVDELEQARVTLAELGALTGESSHGATKSLYAHDPDGNEFEVMWMLPRASWGDFEHTATVERLDLAGEYFARGVAHQ